MSVRNSRLGCWRGNGNLEPFVIRSVHNFNAGRQTVPRIIGRANGNAFGSGLADYQPRITGKIVPHSNFDQPTRLLMPTFLDEPCRGWIFTISMAHEETDEEPAA
jgi:hypothetical protein